MTISHALDLSGALFSLFSTVGYLLVSFWAWPLGMVATLLNGALYKNIGLYGDMCLELIYFFSMLYGAYVWRYSGKRRSPCPVISMCARALLIAVLISLMAVGLTAYLLNHYMHSQTPWYDAITTIFSLLAQWMMCKKIIQTWLVWFAVDAAYVGLYAYKGILVHSFLLLIYLVLAVVGYWRWHCLMKTQEARECV